MDKLIAIVRKQSGVDWEDDDEGAEYQTDN